MTCHGTPHQSQSDAQASVASPAEAQPGGPPDGLAPGVAEQIARYRSKKLSEADAVALAPQIRAGAVACAPPTVPEALALLSNVSRFCAGVLDAHPGLPRDLDVLLSEARIAWWSNRCQQAGESAKTIAVQLPRLRRMRRVLDGLPARMRTGTPRNQLVDVPLDDAALRLLVGGVPDRGVRAGLAAAVGAGLVGRPAVGGSMVAADGQVWFVTAGGEWRLVPAGLEWLARPLVGVVVPDGAWEAAVEASVGCGLVFNRVVAAQTRRQVIFTSGIPVATAIRAYGLSHAGITLIVAHLPHPSADARAAWLRGREGERDCAKSGDAHGAGIPGQPGHEGNQP